MIWDMINEMIYHEYEIWYKIEYDMLWDKIWHDMRFDIRDMRSGQGCIFSQKIIFLLHSILARL